MLILGKHSPLIGSLFPVSVAILSVESSSTTDNMNWFPSVDVKHFLVEF